MAVLVAFRTEGDPEKLLARYDQTLGDAMSMAPARPEALCCVATESGMMIVDVWTSSADLHERLSRMRTSRLNRARLGGQKRVLRSSSSTTRDGPSEVKLARPGRRQRAWPSGRGAAGAALMIQRAELGKGASNGRFKAYRIA